MNSKPSVYFQEIDSLRAIAVVLVIVYHLNSSMAPGGFTGVDIFFVISGYVISKSLYNNRSDNFFEYITSFYKRRIIRIFPALIFCLVITALFATLLIPKAWLSNSINTTGVFAFLGLSNFALVKFDDGYFDPRSEYNPFTHTWSLAVEEQFYLLFPLLFFLWIKHQKSSNLLGIFSRYLLIFLTVISLIYAYFTTHTAPIKAYYYLPSRFWELSIGSLLYQINSSRQFLKRASNAISNLLIPLGLLLLIIGFLFARENAWLSWT
jgi:peptidoglycan/LPS O-acetylase OafA/YrhL